MSEMAEKIFYDIIGDKRTSPCTSDALVDFFENMTYKDLLQSGQVFVDSLAKAVKNGNQKQVAAIILAQIDCCAKAYMTSLANDVRTTSDIFNEDEESGGTMTPRNASIEGSERDSGEETTREDSPSPPPVRKGAIRKKPKRVTIEGKEEGQEDKFYVKSEDPQAKLRTFRHKYPNLPPTFAPRKLLCSLLRPKYLDSLLLTDPHLFPKDWEVAKRDAPDEAWEALNLAVCAHLNKRFREQGLDLEVPAIKQNPYNLMRMEELIEDAVQRGLAKAHSDQESSAGSLSVGPNLQAQSNELAVLTARLKDALSEVTSAAAKLSNRDVVPRPTVAIAQPSLSGPSLAASSSQNALLSYRPPENAATKPKRKIDQINLRPL